MRSAFLLLAAALALVAAGGGESARADVTVALAAPMDGPRASAGKAMRRGAEAAIEAINAQGGLLGQRLVLVEENDGCAAATAAGAAAVIARRAPALVVGHPCSSAAIAAASVYAAAGILAITPGARHPALTERRAGPTVFRLAGRDDRQGEAAAHWLLETAGVGRIAIVHDRTAYARALANDAARALTHTGQGNVPVIPIAAGRKDYSEVAARLADEDIRAVFFAGYPAEAALVVAALGAIGHEIRVLGSDSLATPGFGAALGAHAERVSVLLPEEPSTAQTMDVDPSGASLQGRPYRTLAGRTESAVRAWAGAVLSAGSFTPVEVAAALSKRTDSASGAILFDADGDARIPSYEPARWNGTGWTLSE